MDKLCIEDSEDIDFMSSQLGRSGTFGEAFPDIATMKLTVRIKPEGPLDGRPETLSFTYDQPPNEFIACERNGCDGKGWNIGDVLRDMVSRQQTNVKASGVCRGKVQMGRNSSRYCLCHFEGDLELTYRPKV